MIPKTDDECDEFIAAVSAEIVAALSPHAYFAASQNHDDDRRARATFACDEAEGLLDELQRRARVQRFDDGAPIDPRALNPALRQCAHGVPISEECAECAVGGDLPPPVTDIAGGAQT